MALKILRTSLLAKTAYTRVFLDTRSVTAVEFALIGPVLFLFVFAILVTGMVQFWQFTLDDAVRNAARGIAIGAGYNGGIHNGTDLVAAICAEFGQAAPNCSGLTQYSVQSAASFTGITPAAISASGQLSPASAFPALAVSRPFLLQVVYPVPFNIPLFPMGLATLNGTPSIISAAAEVTEP